MRSFAPKLALAALLIAAPLAGAYASDNPNPGTPWENGGITSYGTANAAPKHQNVDLTKTGSINASQTDPAISPVPFSDKTPLDQD